MSGAPRWGKTFLPKVGRWVTFAGDAVGTYTVNGVVSICVVLSSDYSPAPAAKVETPETGSRPVATPVSAKLSVSLLYYAPTMH